MKQIGFFEMRRLEALSNTIFSVAMTLLAYDLPKASSFAPEGSRGEVFLNLIFLLSIVVLPVTIATELRTPPEVRFVPTDDIPAYRVAG